DANRVGASAVVIVVHHADQEAVVAGAVDGARTLVLRLIAVDHQPVVTGGFEIEVGGREVEIGVAARHRVALVVLGVESKGDLAGQRGIGGVGAGWRVEPVAAGDKAGAGVVDDHVVEGGRAGGAVLVRHRKRSGVDAIRGVGVAAADGAGAVAF